jgi:NAD(P)-dependent dehydrogenase (short-subunit alcohol dehydrogenase family)
MQKIVCITGCSSGIGAALAREFHARGCIVYASARRMESLAGLAAAGIRTLPLDVNDDAGIGAAFEVIGREQGRIDILVNNAGFSQVGAAIDLTREDLRRQYETNVIAPIAVARAALPLLRAAAQGGGRPLLVNVGSIVGIVATPFAGAYCSSKAALHSLSDTLRMELAPFGIRVVMLQPGGVVSSFGAHAEAALRLPPDSPYQPLAPYIRARAQAGQQGAQPAELFVKPVVRTLLGDRPPAVIRGGANSVRVPLLKKLLPTALLDNKLGQMFGLDRLAAK